MGHHENGVGGVAREQAVEESAGLGHQLHDRPVASPASTAELQLLGRMAPLVMLVGEAFPDLAAEQAAPGFEIHLQQVVVQLGGHGAPWAASRIAAVWWARRSGEL